MNHKTRKHSGKGYFDWDKQASRNQINLVQPSLPVNTHQNSADAKVFILCLSVLHALLTLPLAVLVFVSVVNHTYFCDPVVLLVTLSRYICLIP